jgi:hypothetical protein
MTPQMSVTPQQLNSKIRKFFGQRIQSFFLHAELLQKVFKQKTKL